MKNATCTVRTIRRLTMTLIAAISLVPVWQHPAAAVTTITGAPAILNHAGETYVLGNNLSSTGTAVWIIAAGVRFDLSGHTITGPIVTAEDCKDSAKANTIGIAVGDVSGVQITNGTVRGFGEGIGVNYSSDIHVSRMTLSGNCMHGLRLSFSAGCFVSDNRITRNLGNGVFLHDSNGNRFIKNEVTENLGQTEAGYGFAIARSVNNTIASNDISHNVVGVALRNGAGNNVVRDNRVDGPGPGGLLSIGIGLTTVKNTIERNTVTGNGTGIYLFVLPPEGSATQNLVQRNVVRGSSFFDLRDDNPGCDENIWRFNAFGTRSQKCIN